MLTKSVLGSSRNIATARNRALQVNTDFQVSSQECYLDVICKTDRRGLEVHDECRSNYDGLRIVRSLDAILWLAHVDSCSRPTCTLALPQPVLLPPRSLVSFCGEAFYAWITMIHASLFLRVYRPKSDSSSQASAVVVFLSLSSQTPSLYLAFIGSPFSCSFVCIGSSAIRHLRPVVKVSLDDYTGVSSFAYLIFQSSRSYLEQTHSHPWANLSQFDLFTLA